MSTATASTPIRDSSHRLPLIATKLRPPAAHGSERVRPRLDQRLDRALDARTRLTLVSAPAGYGKSVAVASWLRPKPVEQAWLSLDAVDKDLTRFLRYLVAAVGVARPGFGPETQSLLGAGTSPGVDLLVATLVADFADSDRELVLVLDDYHLISSEQIHTLMRGLVEALPPFVHLVLATREDPPLPIARLRAHGQLLELRAGDLACTFEEAAEYLGTEGRHVDPAETEGILDRTEGWMAGLQLAALALKDRADIGDALQAFRSTRRFVLDYLADEVLDRLEPQLRDFLIRISIADRFDAGLCRALTGRLDSEALLVRAEQSNLFLVPLDPEHTWFRFHHLFADYLRSRIPEGEVATLHRAAADYLDAQGLANDAVPHALATPSADRSVALIERSARAAFDAGELATLLGWLDALPLERVAASLELSSLRVWANFLSGRIPEAAAAAAVVRDPETIPQAGTPEGQAFGRLLTIRGLLGVLHRGPTDLDLILQGIDLLQGDDFFAALGYLALGEIHATDGRLGLGVEAWRTGFALAVSTAQPMAIFPTVYVLATGLNLLGRRAEVEQLCRGVLDEFADARGRPLTVAGLARIALGSVLYEANEVAEARRELEAGFADALSMGFSRVLTGQGGVMAVALARIATGDVDGAVEFARSTSRNARTLESSQVVRQATALEAQLALSLGDLPTALRWAEEEERNEAAASELIVRARLQREITLARVHLAHGRPAPARAAVVRARAAAGHDIPAAFQITLSILEAAASEAQGRRDDALAALRRAVELGAPAGYLRRFVDDGATLVALLPMVRKSAPEFVDRVSGALAGAGTQPAGGAGGLWHSADGELLEPLTIRELEVLRLMASGRTNAALAEELVVSLATAKWHVSNLLAKLGTSNRTQALVKAQRLGLI